MRIRMRIRIRIKFQGFDDQKLEKIDSWKFFFIILIKIAFYLSLGLHKGRLSYRRRIHNTDF